MDDAREAAVEVAAKKVFVSTHGGEIKTCGNIISAFEAALWQPIETAPRDGTRVLVFAPAAGSEYPANTQRVDRWHNGGWRQMRPAQPYTHFRHLSAGPNADGP